jgi:hypothetical protein
MINLHTYLFTFNIHEFVLILKLGASGLKYRCVVKGHGGATLNVQSAERPK